MTTVLSHTALPHLPVQTLVNNIRRSPISPPLCRFSAGRMISKLSRPSPPPLDVKQQRELEELLRNTQRPSPKTMSHEETDADLTLHPDSRRPLTPEFDGDINPKTGEQGGPKQEPVNRWGQGDGDWSFKGRVSDF